MSPPRAFPYRRPGRTRPRAIHDVAPEFFFAGSSSSDSRRATRSTLPGNFATITGARMFTRLACRLAMTPLRVGRATLAACALLASGCGGNVAEKGPVDASGDTPETAPTPDAATTDDNSPADTSSSDTPPNADATSCRIVVASDYDQSCTVDTDCVAVGEVTSCPAFACDGCTTVAINKLAMPQYQAAFAQAFASAAVGVCGCPCESGAICRGGQCQAAFCAPSRADTLPACADAGGTCGYSANTVCSATGPPDSCAYSDEVCCL